MTAYFDSEPVRRLQVLAEEATRAKPGSPEARFVHPDQSVIDRLSSRFHHVIFGRRGSGKSSLLRHIQATQRHQGRLAAWVDYEILMNLSFPDVLVSTLEQMFSDFASQLASMGDDIPTEPKGRWRHRRWEKTVRRDSRLALLHDMREVAGQLGVLKNSPDAAEVTWTGSQSDAFSIGRASEVAASAGYRSMSVKASASESRQSSRTTDSSVTSTYSARKDEHLERVLPLYRALILRLTDLYPDAFVILDELYRLREEDQPQVVGYLHRVVKDTGVWLKIGSLRLGTRLYRAGPPSIGLQAPHDIKELSLDRGLLDFNSSKRFLESILAALANEVEVEIDSLLSAGALDRLVLASGGVPRDYLGILSESIAVARGRGVSAKAGSHRIIAEDVNKGAGRTVESKYQDLDEHAGARAAGLRRMIIELTDHCRTTDSACFLIDVQDAELAASADMLQNMRFAHTVDTNESLPDSGSSRYNVYLFDISQLAWQRALQVDFMGWTIREKRRSRKLVFRRDATRKVKSEQSPPSDARGVVPLPGLELTTDDLSQDPAATDVEAVVQNIEGATG